MIFYSMSSEEDHFDIEAMAAFLPQTNEKVTGTEEPIKNQVRRLSREISRSQVIVIENNNDQQVYFAEDGFKDSGKSKKASRYVKIITFKAKQD